MKRIAAGLAVIVVSVAGFYLLMFSLGSADSARGRLTSALAAWTGREVSLGERTELRLFPSPRLTLYDLRVAGPEHDPAAEILTADSLQADIRLLPLLIGRFSFSALALTGPDFRFTRDAEERRNWRLDSGSAAVQLALTGNLPFGRIILEDATVNYEDIRRNERETVLVPDLLLDWESLGQPATVRGSVSVRDERFSFEARIADPLAFLDRKSTASTMMLAGDQLDVRLAGQLADYRAVRFSGSINASSPSLRRLIAFFGGNTPGGPGLGPVTIAGNAEIKPDGMFIDQGQIELDGNPATGTLSVKLADKPVLGGTLAFQTLDLTPYLQVLGGTGTGTWSERRLDTDWFDNLDADLRLSADQIVAGPYVLGGTAASAFLKETRLEIGLAQSEFYGGVISGNISVTDLPRDTGQELAVQLRATDFDLGQAVNMAGSPPDLGGTATMGVDLRSQGMTLGQQGSNLSGSVSVVSIEGAIPDLGLGVASQALAANAPLKKIARGGASAYQRLKIGGTLARGILTFSEILLTTEAYSASLQGSFRFDGREADLGGTMKVAEPAERQGRVEIRGPISEPTVTMTPAPR